MFNRVPRLIQAAAIVAAAIVAGAAVTAIGKPAPLPALPSSIVTVVIDLPKVLNGLNERTARNADLGVTVDELKKKKDDYQKELESLKKALDLIPPGPARVAAQKALEEKKIRYKFELDLASNLAEGRQAEALRDLGNKIQAAAAKLAQLRGYHLVISSDASVTLEGNGDDITRTISLRRVLYSDPQIEITDELVQFMNNEFAAGGGANPAPAAAPKK